MSIINSFSWRDEKISQLILGTAQFGSDYGIANKNGKVDDGMAKHLIYIANAFGTNCVDTAQDYGNSEQILGETCLDGIFVISKFSNTLDMTKGRKVQRSIQDSLKRMRRDQVWCMMIHNEDWLDKWDSIKNNLIKCKEKGYIKYIGISLYGEDKLKQAIDIPEIDIVQFPCNVWDQRLLRNNLLKSIDCANKLCLIRSIYLQGLLVMSPDEVNRKLPKAFEASKQWDRLAKDIGMSKQHISIFFANALNLPYIFGVESKRQLFENMDLASIKLPRSLIDYIHDQMKPYLYKDIWSPKLW